MSSSWNFLLRYAPDCTFSSRKMKKLPTVGGGTPPSPRSVATLPRAWSLRSLAKIVPPPNVLAHYATVGGGGHTYLAGLPESAPALKKKGGGELVHFFFRAPKFLCSIPVSAYWGVLMQQAPKNLTSMQAKKQTKQSPEYLPEFIPEFCPIWGRIFTYFFFFGGGGHSAPTPRLLRLSPMMPTDTWYIIAFTRPGSKWDQQCYKWWSEWIRLSTLNQDVSGSKPRWALPFGHAGNIFLGKSLGEGSNFEAFDLLVRTSGFALMVMQ